MIYVTNAFSVNMLDHSAQQRVTFTPMSEDDARQLCRLRESGTVISAVGHADTAAVFSGILGFDVQPNRVTVNLDSRSRLLLGQYTGPRLQEGATTLPDGAVIKWWLVKVGA